MNRFLLKPLVLTVVQALVIAENGQAALLLPDDLQRPRRDLLRFVTERTEGIADLITPAGEQPVSDLPLVRSVVETSWFASLLASSPGGARVAIIDASVFPLDRAWLRAWSSGTSDGMTQMAIGMNHAHAGALFRETWTSYGPEEWRFENDLPSAFEQFPYAAYGTETYSPSDVGVASLSPLFGGRLFTESR